MANQRNPSRASILALDVGVRLAAVVAVIVISDPSVLGLSGMRLSVAQVINRTTADGLSLSRGLGLPAGPK